MIFHIITLFPESIEPYLKSSIVGRARTKKLVKVKYYDLLSFASNKHKKAHPRRSRRVDDRPYGGGPGMVVQIEPIMKALQAVKIRNKQKVKIILFSATGKQFNNASAAKLAKNYNELVLICGRYEGIDERVKRILRDELSARGGSASGGQIEELSVGPYVLTGGELPAMIFIDAVSRQVKGVLGKEKSLEEKRLGVGVPVYTRPEIFTYQGKKYRVPKVLLSGDHANIKEWRKKHKKLTKE